MKFSKVSLSIPNDLKLFSLKGLTSSDGFTNVSAKRNQTQILTDISFEAKVGEILGFIGKNGAGKSTVLRLAGGIYNPSNGKIFRNGKTRSILSLGSFLMEDLSGRDNITALACYYDFKNEINERVVSDIVDFCEIGDYIDMPLRTYSSGMKMKLCFGALTAGGANNIILDEVVSVGDDSFKERAKHRMKKFLEKSDCVLVASHNSLLINDWCTKVITMENGKIIDEQ